MTTTRMRLSRSIALVGCAALLITGCTNAGTDDAAPTGSAGTDAQQVVKTTESSGEGCTLEKYGAEKINLQDAVVGFSQSEPNTAAFRAAETQSIRAEAESVGIKRLIVTNANAELPKQIADIQDLLNQGVDLLIVAPVNSDGLDPAFNAAKEQGVPIITIDRKVNSEWCGNWVTFIGSDFVDQGRRAADSLAKATDGEAKVAILLGSSGNNVTEDRTQGFKEQVAAEYPGIEIVAEQTGNFARDEGQAVTEQLLASNPDINAIYAENDEMGLGAINAIQAAGLQPGVDVKIVSIDGTRDAVQALVDGRYNGVIESNPRFGPLAFQTLEQFLNGEEIPEDIIIEDKEYTPENAESELPNSY